MSKFFGWICHASGYLYHDVNNKSHNEKSPAVIIDKENKFWYQNYKYHRLDGPAMEFNDGEKYWYYQGKLVECKSQQEFERFLKLKLLW